ncbi:cadherin domain-containing protein [Polaribacter pectinis]|uniref:Cadherin domain-containing protein n=1 Tax=Polaribacter pectinis TaxID=2738844 RepID=A0A7G9L7G2_9FLAO|nr:LamG-like jellyroll fold domain-containing protein [Polaribacter pectinis]QNM84561.1 cadherin domain-containing protein [Polaribacter pectinis]
MKDSIKINIWHYLVIIILLFSCSKDEVNIPPVVENQEFIISEGNLIADLGTVIATDPDNENLIFSIVSQSVSNAIAIKENTGVLQISDATAFDFEINQSLTAIVRVSDGSASAEATITIKITDEIDQAPLISDQTFSIDENPAQDDAIGTITATDAQNLPLTYKILSETPALGFLNIDANNGNLVVKEFSNYDYEKTMSFTAKIEVSNGTLTSTATITININNISPPTNGLIAHYQMSDNSKNYAVDSSGNNNHADFDISTTTGIPSLTTGFDNQQNHAFTNPNSAKNVVFKHNTSTISQANSFTISGHIKISESGNGYLLDDGSLFQLLYLKNAQTGSVSLYVYFKEGPKETRGNISAENFTVKSNGWIHFAITQSGDNLKLYVDGVEFNSTNAITPFHKLSSDGNQTLRIGSQSSLFLGSLDNFIIYDRRLSDAEVKILSLEEN